MSSKTKIVVLRMKEVIYTGIFAALGILLVILLVIMFLPEGEKPAADVKSNSIYTPGVYTTELILGGQTVDVEVIVNASEITSVRLVNVSETVTTMYPLLQPTLEDLCYQIYETQSLDQIRYDTDNKYTSFVLIEAIRNSVGKALLPKDSPLQDAAESPGNAD